MAVRSAKPLVEAREAYRIISGLNTSPASSWRQLLDDLQPLRTLTDDWDGQGAEPPPPAVLDGALALARDFQAAQVPPADRVIAGVNGTVLFEWHGSDGYLEIEVTAADRAEGRLVPKESDTAEEFWLSLQS